MRNALRLALLGIVLWPVASFAQSPREKLQLMPVRVGFPPGPRDQPAGGDDEVIFDPRQSVYKPGAWAPVYVNVINGGKYDPDPKKDGPAFVVVETSDCDDTSNNYTLPLPPLGVNDQANLIAYVRPGNMYSDIIVHVQTAGGRELCPPAKISNPGLDPQQVLYLALGSRLPGLRLPGQQQQQPQAPRVPGVMNDGGPRADAALLTRVSDLPTRWFGYDAANVVILATSDQTFMNGLIGDPTRTAALADWVRRGGRLIVLAGSNVGSFHNNVAPDLQALLPADIDPRPYKVSVLQPLWPGVTPTEPINAEMLIPKLRPREKSDRTYHVLMEGPKVPQAEGSPLIVQGPYGLGQVTVVALDLDKAPFSRWAGRGVFWEQLLAHAGPRVATGSGSPVRYGGMGRMETESDQQLQELYQQLETFEGVPVISFGWVALFILLYILVVGPLDYLFLKKVVKRLELTWITFPTVVLAVSAGAYFTAYYLKGSELRVNKRDLVDIDLQTRRVYGRTWFSIFSPRIQKYTVGVQPADTWAGANPNAGPDVTVTWFGPAKSSRQSLFRHSYDYAPQAEGLRGVPIQVWTTKGFQASWESPLPKDAPPIENQLRHPPGEANELIGFITSHLPAPLEDAVLIYRGKITKLGTLLPDQKKPATAQAPVEFRQWVTGAQTSNVPLAPGTSPASLVVNQLPVGLLFAEAWVGQGDANNASMRTLDESWRVDADNHDEAILVGRLRTEQGDAESVTASPFSPSQLWLGELPSSNKPRPPVSGKMRQDTFVRVFLPIAPERP